MQIQAAKAGPQPPTQARISGTPMQLPVRQSGNGSASLMTHTPCYVTLQAAGQAQVQLWLCQIVAQEAMQLFPHWPVQTNTSRWSLRRVAFSPLVARAGPNLLSVSTCVPSMSMGMDGVNWERVSITWLCQIPLEVNHVEGLAMGMLHSCHPR